MSENVEKRAMSDEEFIKALDKSILEGTADVDPSLGPKGGSYHYLRELSESQSGFIPEPDETRYSI